MFLIILLLGAAGVLGFNIFRDRIVYPQTLKKIEEKISTREYDEALKLINNLPEKRRTQPNIQFTIHEIYTGQKQYFLALFHLSEILKRGVFEDGITELKIHEHMAQIYEAMDKPKKALNEYYAILGIDPEDLNANKKVGEKLFHMRNYAAAEPYLLNAIDKGGDDVNLNLYLGEIKYINQDYEQAISLSNRVINMGNAPPAVFHLRGRASVKLKDWEGALSDLDIAQQDPKCSDMARIFMGIAHFYRREYEKAESNFSVSLTKFNEDYSDSVLEARYLYSDLHYRNGRLKEAANQLYFIRNSGKTWADTTQKIALITRLLANKTLQQILQLDIGKVVDDYVSKGIGLQGHSVLKKIIISDKNAFLILRKNAASGQSYRSVMGLDLNTRETDDDLMKKFIIFVKKEELTSGMFFSLSGIEAEAGDSIKSAKLDIQFLDDKQFEQLIKGELPL